MALASRLEALERKCSIGVGTVRILPVATETPAAVFGLGATLAVRHGCSA